MANSFVKKLNVGDRVRCIKAFDGNNEIVNKEGTLVSFEADCTIVEFDDFINGPTYQRFIQDPKTGKTRALKSGYFFEFPSIMFGASDKLAECLKKIN